MAASRPAQSRRPVLFKGVAFNWISLVISALVSFALTPIMLRALGQQQYGMWILTVSLVDQYGLLDLGIGSALSRYAAYFQGAEERTALDEILSTSLAFTLLISACVCLATMFAAAFLPGFFGFVGTNRPTFTGLAILLGLTTALAFPERMIAAYLRGIQRFELVNILGTGAVLVRGSLVFAALSLGYNVLVLGVVTLAIAAVSLIFHYLAVGWADPSVSLRRANVKRARFRELLSFSTYAFIANLGTRLITRVDTIVIARVLSVALIAPFSIGSRLMDYFGAVFAGVHGPLLSRMSELDGKAQHQELRDLFLRSTRMTILLTAVMGTMMIFDGRAFLALWLGKSGMDLGLTYQVLVILTCCYVVVYSQLPAWSAIYARARHQLLSFLVFCEGAANLGLSIYWARRYGLVGVALGTAIPAIVHHVLVIPWYGLRVVGVSPRLYFKQALLRPLAVGSIFAAFCFLTSRSALPLLSLLLTALAQLTAFALLTYLVGLSAADKKEVHGQIQRVLGWSSTMRKNTPVN